MEDRVKRERERYNRGFDVERHRYDASFGHANTGYDADNRRRAIREVTRRAKGKKVLELGSSGWVSLLDTDEYAPSQVTCVNISETELERGRELYNQTLRSKGTCPEFQFLLMDANHLEFPDGSFDAVVGEAILHHLDFERAVQEVRRVLKTGGFCFFAEPMGRNPVGKIIRKLTPEARTVDEKPLGRSQLKTLDRQFKTKYQFFQLFYVPMGVLSRALFKSPYNSLMRVTWKIDTLLETHTPMGFRTLYRYVHIYGEKVDP